MSHRTKRSTRLAAVLLVGAVGVVAAKPVIADSSGPTAQAAAKRVTIGDNFFRPRTLRVGRGGAVTWHWSGHNRHDVEFLPKRGRPRNCGARRSGNCTRRFRRRGSYSYICVFHANMQGTIRVR